MNAVIEMHDSKCIDIKLDEKGYGFVLLDAYVHRSDGDPLNSPHEGGYQRFRIKIEDVSIDGIVGDLPAYIYEGSLTVGTDGQDNIVRFPAAYAESIRLSMMLSDDARVVIISGHGLSIEPEGEFIFIEKVDFS